MKKESNHVWMLGKIEMCDSQSMKQEADQL